MKSISAAILMLAICSSSNITRSGFSGPTAKRIITGAEQTEKYVPYLKGKRIGILLPTHGEQN